MKKIQIQETGWDEEEVQDQQQSEDPHKQAISAMQNLNLLDKVDKEFDKIYKTVTSLDNEALKVFSAKVQKLELEKFAGEIGKRTRNKKQEEYEEEIDALFGTGSKDILKIFQDNNVQNNRKKLYELYNEISNLNPITYRMLQVYLNNILVKNMQTKQFLNINPNENNQEIKNIPSEIQDQIMKFMKMLMLYFDIQPRLKNKIIPETLKYGDYFVEIIDLSMVDSILDQKVSLLTEGCEKINKDKSTSILEANLGIFENCSSISNEDAVLEESSFSKMSFNEQMVSFIKRRRGILDIEESDINLWRDIKYGSESEFKIEDFADLDFSSVEDIYLKLIEPSQVLKIEKDGYHFGFLVIEDIDEKDAGSNEVNLYQRFLQDDENADKDTIGRQESMLADKIVDTVGNKLAELMTKDSGFMSELPDELLSSLRIIAYEKIKKKTKMKFRFLQPDKLINFHMNIDKYAPYGTSIFDPIIVPVKMYTIATMSGVISRLSRAAVMRKWNIEVGTKRNYPEIVEKVKQDLRSKSITYDDLSSIKNISQIMTDYRDIAVISQNGQRFIDMEILPMSDRSLPLNDLQDLRNELIAATGIPSVFLNVGDAVELRETLVNLNIGFANTINTYQSYFEDSLNKLMNSVFDIILIKNGYDTEFKLSQYYKISMNSPLVLQLQNNEATISTIGNIIGLLEQAKVKIDPLELFKMYSPNIDWDTLVKSGENAIKEEMKDAMIKGGDQGGGY